MIRLSGSGKRGKPSERACGPRAAADGLIRPPDHGRPETFAPEDRTQGVDGPEPG